MSPPRALFVARGEGSGSEWLTIKADAAATGGALGLVEGSIPFGHSPQLHVHRDEDEAFYVLDGAIDVVCGEERFRAERGAFAYLWMFWDMGLRRERWPIDAE
jgi:mannose-6-phosphate isomerase-like protein (cupin superfamily)